jgi:D-galactarolactone isomerase
MNAHNSDLAASDNSRRLGWTLPPHAVDCHHHIYDPRFPMREGAPPIVATVEQYKDLKRQLGITRSVIVQPSAYGTDNRCLLDALAYFGDDARGIAVVPETISDQELAALHDAGVRGIRFNLKQKSDSVPATMKAMSRRMAELGWHIQINATSQQIVELSSVLSSLACPLVIDHMGHAHQPEGLNDPVVKLQLDLLETGNTWIKLSGAYIDSQVGAPGYEDVTPVAHAFVKARPDRLVWGSDWPHPTAGHNMPDDLNLLDLLAVWVPDAATRDAILTSNAARLYSF